MSHVKATPAHVVTLLTLLGLVNASLRSIDFSKDQIVILTEHSRLEFTLDFYKGWRLDFYSEGTHTPYPCSENLSDALFEALVSEGYSLTVCRQLKGRYLWKRKQATTQQVL